MHEISPPDQEFGRLHPHAPAQLAHFAFLIGAWRCEAKLLTGDGVWQSFDAAWVGRFLLDGYAIADEYRMTDATGELIVLGMNVRSYDTARQTWQIRWLNALAGDWTDLTAASLGGVEYDGRTIRYAFREPVAGHAYTRATYTDNSPTHVTWRGEKSDDGMHWTEFMVVEAYRTR